MALNSVHELVNLLRSRVLRVRTGLWLTPIHLLGQEPDEAARVMVEAVDLSNLWLSQLPSGTRFVGITPDKLIEVSDQVAQQVGTSDCALLYNFDLLLSKLRQNQRSQVWRALYGEMPHRTRAILIAMPAVARDLLPDKETLKLWAQEKRLVE